MSLRVKLVTFLLAVLVAAGVSTRGRACPSTSELNYRLFILSTVVSASSCISGWIVQMAVQEQLAYPPLVDLTPFACWVPDGAETCCAGR